MGMSKTTTAVHYWVQSCNRGLRGELTGSRFIGATVLFGTDSPPRVYVQPASGSPVDPSRRRGRSAGGAAVYANAPADLCTPSDRSAQPGGPSLRGRAGARGGAAARRCGAGRARRRAGRSRPVRPPPGPPSPARRGGLAGRARWRRRGGVAGGAARAWPAGWGRASGLAAARGGLAAAAPGLGCGGPGLGRGGPGLGGSRLRRGARFRRHRGRLRGPLFAAPVGPGPRQGPDHSGLWLIAHAAQSWRTDRKIRIAPKNSFYR